MIKLIYTLRDTATEVFLVPMFFHSEAEARRSVGDVVNRKADDNIICQHPEHFQLFYIGTFDDSTGIFKTVPPEFVTSAIDLVRNSS